MKDYYEILEISLNTSQEEIKIAWREQLQVWHPDRFLNNHTLRVKAEKRTKLINEAYEILGDAVKRKSYDGQRQSHTTQSSTTQAEAKIQITCPNPACSVGLSIVRQGRLKVRCPECRCSFIFDNEMGKIEAVIVPRAATSSPPSTPPDRSKKNKSRWHLAGLLGAAIGYGLSKYPEVNLLIPLAGTGILWWTGTKLLGIISPNLEILAVQGGYLLWLLIGLYHAEDSFIILPDIVILLIGLAWYYRRPGWGAIISLCIYQSLGIIGTIYNFLEASVASPAHQALVIHLIWRCIALGLMTKALWDIHRVSRRTEGRKDFQRHV